MSNTWIVLFLISETFDAPTVPKPQVKPFDPTDHDLDPNFRLTSFADLKGWGCKLPQEVLLKLLEGIKEETGGQNQFMQSHTPKIGAKIILIHYVSNFVKL